MRNLVSVFFTILFLVFLATPSIISTLETNFDFSYIYSSAEEEQKSEEKSFGEKSPKLISKFFSYNFSHSEFLSNTTPGFHMNYWETVYFELHSPPPEII